MFDAKVQDDAQAHAMREFPKESCGIVVDGKYVPVDNIAEDPLESFRMPDDIFLKNIQAVIHSHNHTMERNERGVLVPHHPHYPTMDDMRSQIETDVPWGIVSVNSEGTTDILWWGDQRLDDPLIGREFIPGVADCFSIIRSYFHQTRGVRIPDLPRNAEWWSAGENHLLENFEWMGFKVIDDTDIQIGDCVFMRLHSDVPCHCGVIVDDYLLLHHLENRLSRREPIGPWRKYITHWLRYDP